MPSPRIGNMMQNLTFDSELPLEDVQNRINDLIEGSSDPAILWRTLFILLFREPQHLSNVSMSPS